MRRAAGRGTQLNPALRSGYAYGVYWLFLLRHMESQSPVTTRPWFKLTPDQENAHDAALISRSELPNKESVLLDELHDVLVVEHVRLADDARVVLDARAPHERVLELAQQRAVDAAVNGQRRRDRRLWRRLARAPEAVAGRPVGRPLSGSAELPRAARCALRRCRSRAGVLPRGHFSHAARRWSPRGRAG
eukprot:scaffold64450_cov66-Phaeocystis_antarctica.AAC.1